MGARLEKLLEIKHTSLQLIYPKQANIEKLEIIYSSISGVGHPCCCHASNTGKTFWIGLAMGYRCSLQESLPLTDNTASILITHFPSDHMWLDAHFFWMIWELGQTLNLEGLVFQKSSRCAIVSQASSRKRFKSLLCEEAFSPALLVSYIFIPFLLFIFINIYFQIWTWVWVDSKKFLILVEPSSIWH